MNGSVLIPAGSGAPSAPQTLREAGIGHADFPTVHANVGMCRMGGVRPVDSSKIEGSLFASGEPFASAGFNECNRLFSTAIQPEAYATVDFGTLKGLTRARMPAKRGGQFRGHRGRVS